MRALITALLLLSGISVFGQITPRLFEFGPKVGVHLSNVSPVDTFTYDQSMKMGLQGGIFTRFNFGKLSIQPEFIYQAKGTKLKKPIVGTHTYRYFSTPVLVGYAVLDGIYLEAGYERNWALNKYNPTRQNVNSSDFGPGKGADQSLIFGTRINLLDAFSLFSVNIRYVHGLDNVSNFQSNNVPLEFKNRSIQVSATYTFSEQYLWNKKYGPKKKKK